MGFGRQVLASQVQRPLVGSADFRSIAAPGTAGRPERLFRAAIHAFCCIPRPTRHEVAQLDDLAVPLLPQVSPGARRFASAALSECKHVPPRLIEKLCDDRPEIAAPLLIRSQAITDIDLISLIGRHGLGHARIIARRKDLAQPIVSLIRALEAASQQTVEEAGPEHEVDRIRRELRAMMHSPDRPVVSAPLARDSDAGTRIVMAALSGSFSALGVALGNAIGTPAETARHLLAQRSGADLAVALKALGLSEERSFLVMSCVAPARFTSVRSIRNFVDDYRALEPRECREALEEWRTALAAQEPSVARAANSDGPSALFRAS